MDIGANLTHESFSVDFADVLNRARQVGVSQIIVTGASLQGSIDALQLAQQHSGYLWATAGIHPHHANETDATTLAQLRDLAAQPQIKASERQVWISFEIFVLETSRSRLLKPILS